MTTISNIFMRHRKLMAFTILLAILAIPVAGFAQGATLGNNGPSTGKAVRGQDAQQVEGGVLNAVNWVSNVICPVIAALCFVSAGFKYQAQKPYVSSVVGGGVFLGISAVTRLIEYFIQQGQAVGQMIHYGHGTVVAVVHVVSRLA